jgi:hypothetical protein
LSPKIISPKSIIEFDQIRLSSGPTEQTMDEGWFRCELLGWGSEGQRVRGLIADKGDPGNRANVKFVCESALGLAVDFDRLPGGTFDSGDWIGRCVGGEVERGRNAA